LFLYLLFIKTSHVRSLKIPYTKQTPKITIKKNVKTKMLLFTKTKQKSKKKGIETKSNKNCCCLPKESSTMLFVTKEKRE